VRGRALPQPVQLRRVLRGDVRGRPQPAARPQRDLGRLRPPVRRAPVRQRREDQVDRYYNTLQLA